jgi:hypothetical protein
MRTRDDTQVAIVGRANWDDCRYCTRWDAEQQCCTRLKATVLLFKDLVVCEDFKPRVRLTPAHEQRSCRTCIHEEKGECLLVLSKEAKPHSANCPLWEARWVERRCGR